MFARCGALPLTVVQDGAPELWNLVDDWLASRDWKATAKLIDRYHVDERLAQVCEAITYDAKDARALYATWRARLDRSDTAIIRICRRLESLSTWLACGAADDMPMPRYWRSRARRYIDNARSSVIASNLDYFERYRTKISYASARRRGLPIGSGVTEGACKSVIGMRCKRSGQRWFESGLSPCLRLRSLHLNRRLRACFDLIVSFQTASLAAA
ncbi:hypothetical protein BH11MYX2_BH11MYX2_39150 [soil metagenome]